jgi:hypothetical protein
MSSFSLEVKGLYVDNLDFVVEDFCLEAGAFNEVDDPGQHLVGMPLVITDAADANGGQLPVIVIIHLGYGDIKFIPHPAGDRLQDLPFALEGHIFRQSEADPGNTNIHDGKKRLFTFLIYHPPAGVSNINISVVSHRQVKAG